MLSDLLNFQTDGENWHNPLAPAYHEENVERCPFFQRTGACRFGERFVLLTMFIVFE